MRWIWQALELGERSASDLVELAPDVQMQLMINLADDPLEEAEAREPELLTSIHSADSIHEAFPLIEALDREGGNAIHRFSVTQLINYHRCPRQYYFDRVLQMPSRDELAVWNNAEAPEPPANLTATLKGSVIHRFCERYTVDQGVEDCLRNSFEEVLQLRQAQLADRLIEINREAAIKELLPLAKNYLASDVFKRVEAVPKVAGEQSYPTGGVGLWSEISFRLRRPLGILFGIIDKLLVSPAPEGDVEIEIIDFKTNRISLEPEEIRAPRPKRDQFAFDFEEAPTRDTVHTAAEDYQLQMQAYALAVRELLPEFRERRMHVTLHFLGPNVEVHLADELLAPTRCEQAIDTAMQGSIFSSNPADFPTKTAPHCRMCNFLRVCKAGKEWVGENQ
jgi:ATP-dependent exoDNAse (exonuclease V) beta subunit